MWKKSTQVKADTVTHLATLLPVENDLAPPTVDLDGNTGASSTDMQKIKYLLKYYELFSWARVSKTLTELKSVSSDIAIYFIRWSFKIWNFYRFAPYSTVFYSSGRHSFIYLAC